MRNFILVLLIFVIIVQNDVFAQYSRIFPTYGFLANSNLDTAMMRVGKVGYGFPKNNSAFLNSDLNNRSKLTVTNGLMSHYVSGQIGNLDNSHWCGLGIGNPGGFPNPYGLAIAENNNIGFYNILFNDLIAGFGSATANASNRFRIRAYNNAATDPLDSKDILIANPNGAVGINAEPISSLYVNSVLTNNPGPPNPLFKVIAIEGAQIADQFSTASGMGNQQNSSLVADNVLVEGVRSQWPKFSEFITGDRGLAVNLQTVRFDNQPNSAIPQINEQFSYAELTWQNLEFNQDVTREIADFESRPANFYISFRSGRPGVPSNNAFSNRNKLPVATFTPTGRVGIATTIPNENFGGQPVFLDVNGFAVINGNLVPSDSRYKKDVLPISDALNKIKRIQGTTYTMKHEEFPKKNFGQGLQYGYIAQELEKVIPELALKGDDGYYAVNYIALIPVLSEAIKELDTEVTNLKNELAAKDAEIENIKGDLQEMRNQIKVLSKSGGSTTATSGYELFQNTPNPTAGITSIRYTIPENVNFSNASVNIYDMTGKTIQSYSIGQNTGEVKINVANLAAGTYLYDLLVDMTQIEIKKMVVVKY